MPEVREQLPPVPKIHMVKLMVKAPSKERPGISLKLIAAIGNEAMFKRNDRGLHTIELADHLRNQVIRSLQNKGYKVVRRRGETNTSANFPSL